MKRNEVKELHYITLISNTPSILRYGILSHNQIRKMGFKHASIAKEEVQDLRKNKKVQGGHMLHDYVNLYFDAHNPMLSLRRDRNDEICVLGISSNVLDLPEVAIADRNAARDWARFYPVAEGLAVIDRDKIYATYWNHPDLYEKESHKALKCAEVLVPHRIDNACIQVAYVANNRAETALKSQGFPLPIKINRGMFF